MVSRSHDILPLTVYNYLEMRCNICLFQNPERKIKLSDKTFSLLQFYTQEIYVYFNNYNFLL